VARTRTTKKLAQRIDLNYFKRPTSFKRAKFLLCAVVPLLAIAWILWHSARKDSLVYSSGRMSEAHAVLEKQCAACHTQVAGQFSAKAADNACAACHDGPVHHENQLQAGVPDCATCHVEHRGRINLRAVNNQNCAQCHSNLNTIAGPPAFAAHIESFASGHPEFAVLRGGKKDSSTILLNHAIHMQPIRRGPNGPIVQLQCGNCHQPKAAQPVWIYANAQYLGVPTYLQTALNKDLTDKETPREKMSHPPHSLEPRTPPTGLERMAPVNFATGCSGCHLLTFDKRFDEGVPHDRPEVVHAYLLKTFQQYIAIHPGEVRVARDPNRPLTGKPLLPEVRVLTPAQWVAERTADAEELLWRKTCKQCHALAKNANDPLPAIAAAQTTERWLPHAKFDHDAHRGFSCEGCHAKALNSKDSSDVLIPGIQSCQTCHAPGPSHAESRCFECHTYHDWSKRNEVQHSYTLPALQSGAR
jgi:hypothetical protein